MRGRGPTTLAGTREYKQSNRGRWQAEGVKVLWNLECPIGLSQKINMYAFQKRKFGAIWAVRQKKKQLWSYVVIFNLVGWK